MSDLLHVARAQFVKNGYQSTTMDQIAAAAGLTKPTLYSWHSDKESLFRACLIDEAARFPVPDLASDMPPESALASYALALLLEFSSPQVYDIGLCYLRESAKFPDMLPVVQRVNEEYLVKPLAAYLVQHGLEKGRSTERARLFLMMALAPVHSRLLLGERPPSQLAVRKHARITVDFFLFSREPSDAAASE